MSTYSMKIIGTVAAMVVEAPSRFAAGVADELAAGICSGREEGEGVVAVGGVGDGVSELGALKWFILDSVQCFAHCTSASSWSTRKILVATPGCSGSILLIRLGKRKFLYIVLRILELLVETSLWQRASCYQFYP